MFVYPQHPNLLCSCLLLATKRGGEGPTPTPPTLILSHFFVSPSAGGKMYCTGGSAGGGTGANVLLYKSIGKKERLVVTNGAKFFRIHRRHLRKKARQSGTLGAFTREMMRRHNLRWMEGRGEYFVYHITSLFLVFMQFHCMI